MDVFALHRRVIDEYRTYLRSFGNIADEQVRAVVRCMVCYRVDPEQFAPGGNSPTYRG